MDMRCRFGVEATLVANEFIDRYMGAANGEYVKVYLYLLRHQGEPVTAEGIAEALNYTEADVKRAIVYWERMGALGQQSGQSSPGRSVQQSGQQPAARQKPDGQACSPEQMSRLQGDEGFAQLLFVAQQYMEKVLTQRELEVFAYLYDELHMSSELLEYLVEYCAENQHKSIRYIETVALSWHEKKIRTVDEAKAYTAGFKKDTFAVMKEFGLTGRRAGDSELEAMDRWFKEYGFSRELVLEACRRTMEATHNPSFKYADKILSEWRKAGVKSLRDVASLDEKRRSQSRRNPANGNGHPQTVTPRPNQFHNFEQRDTDYNALMMEQVRGWLKES